MTQRESWEDAEQHPHPSDLLAFLVLGLNDGIVTSLVFVLSVAQASQDTHKTVVIAGLAEMLAGGVSMFLGGYSASRASREAYQFQVEVERREIEHEPDEERAEIARMYHSKGFRGTLLHDIVHHVTSDPDRWLRVMVRDELGRPPDEGSSTFRTGAAIGTAFVAGAFVPLIPFVLSLSPDRFLALTTSLVALVGIGIFRSRYSQKQWWESCLEMILIALLGSGAGIVIGAALSALAG